MLDTHKSYVCISVHTPLSVFTIPNMQSGRNETCINERMVMSRIWMQPRNGFYRLSSSLLANPTPSSVQSHLPSSAHSHVHIILLHHAFKWMFLLLLILIKHPHKHVILAGCILCCFTFLRQISFRNANKSKDSNKSKIITLALNRFSVIHPMMMH